MKKLIYVFYAFLLFAAMTAVTSLSASELEEYCRCGRDYYTEEGDGHSEYDCVKCGKNMHVCTCTCWCGAPTVTENSSIYGTVLVCTECDKPCLLCTCRSDREAILLAEERRRSGEILSVNLMRSDTLAVIIAVILITGLIVLFTCSDVLFENKKKKSKVLDRKPKKQVPPVKTEPAVQENGGAFELLRIITLFGAKISGEEPVHKELPDDFDVFINADNVTGAGQLSPFRDAEKFADGEHEYDHSADDILKALEKPDVTLYFTLVRASRSYYICKGAEKWYSIYANEEKHGYYIALLGSEAEAAAWISENIDITVSEPDIPSGLDLPVDYDEFCLFCLSQLARMQKSTDSESFTVAELLKPRLCEILKKGLLQSGHPSFAETLGRLTDERNLNNACRKLYEKGLFVPAAQEGYAYSPVTTKVLDYRLLDEYLLFRYESRSSGAYDMTFMLRKNGKTALYDSGSSVRAAAAKAVPWKSYLK